MRTWLLLLGMLAGSGAQAASFKWTVRVMNVETSEVKTYEPQDGAFAVATPRLAQACTLEMVKSETDNNVYYETRALACKFGNSFHVTSAVCSRQVGATRVASREGQALVGNGEPRLRYQITFTCE